MRQKNKLSLLWFTSLCLLLFWGCTPSSSTLRYKNYSGIETHDDSLKSGLIYEEVDDLLYYSQVQDTTSEFQDTEYDEVDSTIEENNVDISSLMQRLHYSLNETDSVLSNSTPQERLLMEIIKYINTPYKFGGNNQDGIDCSAFTQNVFNSSQNYNLLRSAREQFTQGAIVKGKENLVFGDLVFFNTRRRVRPGHVGIFIGDKLFAHASSTKGVIISSLDHQYYSKRFMGGRRINGIFSQK